MSRRRVLAAWLTPVLLAACAGGGELATAEIEAAAEAEMRRRPGHYTNGEARAWLVRRDGAERGLLWGTVHIPYSGETVLPRPIRARFGAAASLLVESILAPAVTAARRRELARAWATADPAALAALDAPVRSALRAARITPADEARHSLLGLSELAVARQPRGLPGTLPALGFVDGNLMSFARSVQIPVQGLESLASSRDPVVAAPNGPAAANQLRLALRRMEGALAAGEWFLAAYGRGEVGRMVAGAAGWRSGPADWGDMDVHDAAMLAGRNRAWMAPLEDALALPGTHFVAVGAAHLPGQEGVVALLRGRGWDVRPCMGDACG